MRCILRIEGKWFRSRAGAAVNVLAYEASVLPPPYRAERRLRSTARTVPRGSVLILNLQGTELGEEERLGLLNAVRRHRRDLAAPVFVRLLGSGFAAHFEWLPRIQLGEVQAILTPNQDPGRVAWQILPHPPDLGSEWLACLGLQRKISPEAATVIRTIVSHAHEDAGVTDLLRKRKVSPRTARATLRRDLLPSPGRFFTAARVVHGHLWLQQDPELTVEHAGWRLGYADPSGFHQASRRLFAMAPGAARELLGLLPLPAWLSVPLALGAPSWAIWRKRSSVDLTLSYDAATNRDHHEGYDLIRLSVRNNTRKTIRNVGVTVLNLVGPDGELGEYRGQCLDVSGPGDNRGNVNPDKMADIHPDYVVDFYFGRIHPRKRVLSQIRDHATPSAHRTAAPDPAATAPARRGTGADCADC